MITEKTIIDAIKTTAMMCGSDLQDDAAKMMMFDLKGYGGEAVMAMLQKLRRTHKGRFSLAQMIELIEVQDGRPGAEQAWGIVSRILADEGATEFLTPEMEEAYYACASIYADQGHIPARQAFKEVYAVALRNARDSGAAIKWQCHQGNDKTQAEGAIKLAYESGKITKAAAMLYLPACADETRYTVETGKVLSLENKQEARAKIGAIVQSLKLGFEKGAS